jgi:dipeptidase
MCDTLCIRHDGGMWFAKNSDRHPLEVQTLAWHSARASSGELRTQYITVPDADAAAFAGSQPAWLWGCEHGINEYGVAAGNEKIWTVDRPKSRPPALLGMDVVRLVLERARTADDALEISTRLIERYGQGGSGEPFRDEPYDSSFLLVDANGGWIVETSNRTWAARPVDAGAAISNRISLTTDWSHASADVAPGTDFDTYRSPKVSTAIADSRLATTRACVTAPDPTLSSIIATMRDHGSAPSFEGITVCMHCRV